MRLPATACKLGGSPGPLWSLVARRVFEEEFNEIGIPIHEYTIDLPVDVHNQIHQGGSNQEWDEFLHEEEGILPSAKETMQLATLLMHEYGIEGYGKLHPYK